LFNDKLVVNAAMDRLLHHVHVIEVTGASYRNPPQRGVLSHHMTLSRLARLFVSGETGPS